MKPAHKDWIRTPDVSNFLRQIETLADQNQRGVVPRPEMDFGLYSLLADAAQDAGMLEAFCNGLRSMAILNLQPFNGRWEHDSEKRYKWGVWGLTHFSQRRLDFTGKSIIPMDWWTALGVLPHTHISKTVYLYAYKKFDQAVLQMCNAYCCLASWRQEELRQGVFVQTKKKD